MAVRSRSRASPGAAPSLRCAYRRPTAPPRNPREVCMNALATLNGKQLPLDQVMIPALDRGFLCGDAVYEVLRVYRGRPFLLDSHMRRLEHSLQGIRIHSVD